MTRADQLDEPIDNLPASEFAQLVGQRRRLVAERLRVALNPTEPTLTQFCDAAPTATSSQ